MRLFVEQALPIQKNMEKLVELPLWSEWKRPDSIPYPNTWHRFTTKSKTGKIYNIKVIDLTPDRFEEVDAFRLKHYYPFEPISQATDVLNDDVSSHNFLLIQKAVSSQCTSLIAVLDEDVPKPRIVGVQKLLVDVKRDEFPNVPGNYARILGKFYYTAESFHNIFEMFGVDVIIRGCGLCVHSEYSGLGIGLNLILSIEKIAKAFGIKVFQAGYTNIRSQIPAEKAGFKLLHEIVYNEFKDEEGQVVLPIEGPSKSFKWGIIEYA